MAGRKTPMSFEEIRRFLDGLLGDDLHAKRVLSLAGATLGVIQTASLAIGVIGRGLALARGRLTKHAIKQVDRMLSNPGIDLDVVQRRWVSFAIGAREGTARPDAFLRRQPVVRMRNAKRIECEDRATKTRSQQIEG